MKKPAFDYRAARRDYYSDNSFGLVGLMLCVMIGIPLLIGVVPMVFLAFMASCSERAAMAKRRRLERQVERKHESGYKAGLATGARGEGLCPSP
jgi:hypothetical protein